MNRVIELRVTEAEERLLQHRADEELASASDWARRTLVSLAAGAARIVVEPTYPDKTGISQMTEAAKKLAAEVESLHAKIDDAVKRRIYGAAAEISGVPVATLKNLFIARCSNSYCRCRAIRNIAASNDGL